MNEVIMNEASPLLVHVDEEPNQISIPHQSLIEFNPNGDPDNPLEWSKAYKLGVVSLLSFMAFTTTFTCIGVVPIASRIVLDLEGTESKSSAILLVTVWELGEAAGPLLIAPLSEVFGRYPVFNIANLIFILGVVLAALSPSSSIFIFSRFLTGLAVAANVLNPAIIGDIYRSEERGSAMSLTMLAPLIGGAIGPAIGGAIAETFGWRTILWMSALLAVVCEIIFFMMLRETYKVRILKRRAVRLRRELRDESLKCGFEGEGEGTTTSTLCWSELRTSITRPMIILANSFVLQLVSIFGGLVFTFYYIVATTLPGMLKDIYDFSPAMIGFSFLSFSIGATLGIIANNMYLDDIYIKLGKNNGGITLPEFRLPFIIGGSAFFPLVITLYGWAPYAQWPVYLLLLAVALLGFLMIMIMVPLTSYIVDAFGLYSASALTMYIIARCLGGTLLPLAIPPLIDSVGLGYGFIVLAAVCVAFIPLPILLMRYGMIWRQNSKYTRSE